jgi:hypothetical protein
LEAEEGGDVGGFVGVWDGLGGARGGDGCGQKDGRKPEERKTRVKRFHGGFRLGPLVFGLEGILGDGEVRCGDSSERWGETIN